MSEKIDMEKNHLDALLTEVKEEMDNRNIVAFLGPPSSGKTVIATLLKDSLFTHFLKNYEKEYDGNMIKGYDFLKKTENEMLNGKFPIKTQPADHAEVVLEIKSKIPLGQGIQIRIKDIAGENYSSLLIAEEVNMENRINNILQTQKTRGARYGPLAFILVSKIYVIMIDCSTYKEWKRYDLDYSHLLKSLLDIQKGVRGDADKINSAIAIILTKADCLSDEINKSAEELIAETMPQFDRSMKTLHSGNKEYFKFSIDADRTDGNEQIENRIKIPWAYSEEEYNRFILWILGNIT